MTPYPTCTEAYRAWGAGDIPFTALDRGAIVLGDGTRCPAADTTHPLQAEVTVPAGQPPYVPPEIGAGHSWVVPILAVGLVLWLVLVVGMVWLQRREDARG